MFSMWQQPGSLLPPPHPWGLPPPVYLLDHSHGPTTHPSSPWSQPLMTWPVPKEKTKGWFWGRLLSNSVPSSSFPYETMGRPVRRKVCSDTPTPSALPIKVAPPTALVAIVLAGDRTLGSSQYTVTAR